MPKGEYEIFEALNPFFEVVMEGLRRLVDGDYYFDTIAEDVFFEGPTPERTIHLERSFRGSGAQANLIR